MQEHWLIAINGTYFNGTTIQKAADLSEKQADSPKITLMITVADERFMEDATASLEIAKLLIREFYGPAFRPQTLIKIGNEASLILKTAEKLKCHNVFIDNDTLKRIAGGNINILEDDFFEGEYHNLITVSNL